MHSSFYGNLLPILLLVFVCVICMILYYESRGHLRQVMQKYNFDETTASLFIKEKLFLIEKYRRMTREMSTDTPDIGARLKHLEESYQDEVDALAERLGYRCTPESE